MMVAFYIDPGTGSMLFAILIGIIGALRYIIQIGMVKLRFIMSGGKAVESSGDKIPFVIFSDNKRYWNVFQPVCQELDARGIDVTYMTSSQDDPALNCNLPHVRGQFIGEGNKAFAKLNFINADLVLSTTPGLDVYQWKKSKNVKCYAHILHAAGEVSLYRMFGIDYYDALLLSGKFQEEDVRKLEKLRNLPEKEIHMVGLPYMDQMVERLNASENLEKNERTVLLAPSWGPSAIFSSLGDEIIGYLLDTGYHVIVRPHPQSFSSEKEMLESIMKKYPSSDQLEWNRDVDNFDVLQRSDILISDFSGVTFDFALVYDKPIIYADTEFDRAPYDAWWLDDEIWTLKTLPNIGLKLTADKLPEIKKMIDTVIEDPKYAAGREKARSETWECYGSGAKVTADWIENKLIQIKAMEA